MSFFDSKQEVLNLELTPYGKNLLASGKFKPVYYSFHDDDVIYDISTIGGSEIQFSSSTRILEETPYLKPQVRSYSSDVGTEKLDRTDFDISTALAITSLGNSSLQSNYAPAWNVRALKGRLRNAASATTSSNLTIQIPQVNASNIEFFVSTKNQSAEKTSLDYVFPDGTAVSVEKDGLLLEIIENNVENKEENFEVEIFERIVSGSSEQLVKIPFPTKVTNIINNILVDEANLSLQEQQQQQREVLVDDYFVFLVDEEVDFDEKATETLAALSQTREEIVKPPFGENC